MVEIGPSVLGQENVLLVIIFKTLKQTYIIALEKRF